MMNEKQIVCNVLTDMEISFQLVEHQAVFTIEEMSQLAFPPNTIIAKNLFLRDAKGKRHFLVVADTKQKIDLKQMETMLGCKRLSFASEERLEKYLGLTKGAVSPFGLLNDINHDVEVYLDKKLKSAEIIGVHPNDNTATVLLAFDDLIKFVSSTNHKANLVDFH